jgi:flavin-binding protein dodecin
VSVYKVLEIIGTSEESWEAAAQAAIEQAAATLEDIRVAEVVKMDVRLDGGKIVEYRTRVMLSFKYRQGFDD